MRIPKALRELCRPIELLVLDVDGVLTDGAIIIDDDGRETKAFFVRDGLAIKCWQRAGKKVAVVSARRSKVVERRSEELKIEYVRQGALDKLAVVDEILAAERLQRRQACFVGDDVVDLPSIRAVGLGVAVADAAADVAPAADYITQAAGGRGAVREVIELLLEAQGRWDEFVGERVESRRSRRRN